MFDDDDDDNDDLLITDKRSKSGEITDTITKPRLWVSANDKPTNSANIQKDTWNGPEGTKTNWTECTVLFAFSNICRNYTKKTDEMQSIAPNTLLFPFPLNWFISITISKERFYLM